MNNDANQWIARDETQIVEHVGIVIRGGTNIDEILIAQISYSSEGFYTSVDEDGNPIKQGRFEVITLRTYLYKHLTNLTESGRYANPIPTSEQDVLSALNTVMLVGQPNLP